MEPSTKAAFYYKSERINAVHLYRVFHKSRQAPILSTRCEATAIRITHALNDTAKPRNEDTALFPPVTSREHWRI